MKQESTMTFRGARKSWLVLLMCAVSLVGASCSFKRAPASIGMPKGWTPIVWTDYVSHGPTARNLPDFSYAGYEMGDQPLPRIDGPVFDVTHPRFGAIADDGIDDTAAIQAAIEAAGAVGGGVVLVPKGRYEIHPAADGRFLRITRDRIVLRGQGSGDNGTILHLAASAPAKGVRRLGSVPAREEARHAAIVAVMGAENRTPLAALAADALRGSRTIKVSDSALLSAGQTVIVEFTDPLIDAAHPAPDKADLAAQLTAPFRFIAAQTDSFGEISKHHAWIVRIEKIIDRHTVRLAKPARFDQWLRYRPRIYSFEGVSQVGIEHLRFQSSWPGGYRHHKPFLDAGGKVVRSAKEQDYLWNGIWISAAVDSWVRDVAFKDLTQGIIAIRSGQITLQELRFHGHAGHAGVTIAHANDLLVKAVDFHARMVHPVTVKMMAAGNVFTACRTFYDGRDEQNATDAVIDFHGVFPYENLFENLDGFYVCPGGDLSVMPHAGVRNVFWNIRAPRCMTCYTTAADSEFARSYDLIGTSSGRAETMFEHFPQAFYIGIQRKGGLPLTMGGSDTDRFNPWMTVEGLNRAAIAIPSLYDAQKRHRIRSSN
jgi:hypothetical protein